MNMYVGNLSYNVKEVDLREVMEEYGTVGSVKLIVDRDTRRSKRFRFLSKCRKLQKPQTLSNS